MDKRTISAFVLIGAVMILFMYINQPSKEQMQAQQHYRDSVAAVNEQLRYQQMLNERRERDSIAALRQDSTSLYFRASSGSDTVVTLNNGLVALRIASLGGRIASATLADYLDQQGEPVTLFSEEDALPVQATARRRQLSDMAGNEFYFTLDGKSENIDTRELYFTPVEATDSSVVMRLPVTADGYLDFSYRLLPQSYLVDFTVTAHGLANFFPSSADRLSVHWNQLVRQQEKGFTFEQRYTTLTYKPNGDDTDHLSETKKTSKLIEQPVDWVAYKNQFFSCIMIADDNFEGVNIASTPMEKGSGYLKDLTASMSSYFDPTGVQPSRFQFYFGPNHYGTLSDNARMAQEQLGVGKKLQLQQLIYFGWPVIRWINRFFTLYLFDWLTSWGLNMGIVLLLLTLIVKALVYPFTYKSYLSSAKMRALKPYVDEISKKYPKPEDAMKKQQETMAMYSRFGVSPMGGCLPMLIQMPIWFALFNFVPNAIELRQQSFLWAKDLSSYDDLLSWNGSIPLLGDHISLFCLLFSAATILNSAYTMRQQQAMAGEQAQQMKMMQWMMYLMPIVFLFTLNDYSSGLNYYYFVSALTSIVIYFVMRKTVDEKELLRKLEARYKANKDKPVKKSSMMAKLEALQKEQERRMAEQQRRNASRK